MRRPEGPLGGPGDEDDDEPLDPTTAADAERLATETVEGTLVQVLSELAAADPTIEAREHGTVVEYLVGGVAFATAHGPTASFRLGLDIAAAAARTVGTRPSPLGPGWVAFTPRRFDRYALDRATAWFGLARRLASTG